MPVRLLVKPVIIHASYHAYIHAPHRHQLPRHDSTQAQSRPPILSLMSPARRRPPECVRPSVRATAPAKLAPPRNARRHAHSSIALRARIRDSRPCDRLREEGSAPARRPSHRKSAVGLTRWPGLWQLFRRASQASQRAALRVCAACPAGEPTT